MNRKIKSTIAVFMAVIMLVTALTFTATSSVSAAEPDDTVYKNGVVEYIISPTNTTSIAGYEINMSYNNTIASAVDVQNMVELPTVTISVLFLPLILAIMAFLSKLAKE